MRTHGLVDQLLLDAIIVLGLFLATLGALHLLNRVLSRTDRRR